MKFSLLTAGLAALIHLSHGLTLLRRASLNEAATIGYATLNGGTTGGAGGSTIHVSNAADLQLALTDNTPTTVVITSPITGATSIRVGSNKTILGSSPSTSLTGIGLLLKGSHNVIIRNLTIRKVLASNGDAISLSSATNVWIDHCDLSSDLTHDKDFYDGLLDITHASDFVTVSHSYFHEHFKASLVGHSDSNAAEDRGTLHVTFVRNRWARINSRAPSFRFGTGHVVNNLYEDVVDGVNTRKGAQLLVEGNVFEGGATKKPLYETDGGFAVERDNLFGQGSGNAAPEGSLVSVPYRLEVLGSAEVKRMVKGEAGATLVF